MAGGHHCGFVATHSPEPNSWPVIGRWLVAVAVSQKDDLHKLLDEVDIDYSKLNKFKASVSEFRVYIGNNKGMITNYGERWRYGETISTAFVESTVNAVVSKRFVKKQQMQWTSRGAHLLLQTRAWVLNDELAIRFRKRYSRFSIAEHQSQMAA